MLGEIYLMSWIPETTKGCGRWMPLECNSIRWNTEMVRMYRSMGLLKYAIGSYFFLEAEYDCANLDELLVKAEVLRGMLEEVMDLIITHPSELDPLTNMYDHCKAWISLLSTLRMVKKMDVRCTLSS